MERPAAFFQRPLKEEAILKSPLTADPLRLLDAAPLCDGASAVLLSSEETVKSYSKDPVYILDSRIAHDKSKLTSREDMTKMLATSLASKFIDKDIRILVDGKKADPNTRFDLEHPEGNRIKIDDLGLTFDEARTGVYLDVTGETSPDEKLDKSRVFSVGIGRNTKFY